MLRSFEIAHNVYGNSHKKMAYECGVTESTFYTWHSGRMRCPKKKRQAVDRALGVYVDWTQYDLEFDAIERLEKPAQRPAAPASMSWGDIPPPTPAKPKTPVSGPEIERNALEEMMHDG